jgi:hypothetical protein
MSKNKDELATEDKVNSENLLLKLEWNKLDEKNDSLFLLISDS